MTIGLEDMDLVDEEFVIPPDMEPELSEFLPKGYLSASAATTGLKCLHQFELRYINGYRGVMSGRAHQGSAVHKGVEVVGAERILTGKVSTVETATDAFSTAFDEKKGDVEDWEDIPQGEVKDLGVKLIKVYMQEAAAKATPIVVEKTFSTVVRTLDGKLHLPVFGRIDSIQVQTHSEEEYQAIRERVVAAPNFSMSKPTVELGFTNKPLRIHDLKNTTKKWSEGQVKNSLQFLLYSGIEHIPDVQIDQLVKGQAHPPRPRYEALTEVVTDRDVKHGLAVLEGLVKSIALGHFPMTDPGNWWCSEKWCSMWRHCRGKK